MSEYTPTTDVVADCFLDGAAGEFLREDFDRWLAAKKAKWQAEAWEQGFHAAISDDNRRDHRGFLVARINPYEKGSDDGR